MSNPASVQYPQQVKISLQLPVDRVEESAEFATASGIAQIAQHAEVQGYDAVYVTDHPAPDQRWLDGGGHHGLDPTVALTAAAMVTTRIRLHTNVYVLTYRNPFLAAKALASLDAVSGGRVIAGVAAGYLKPEFAALGVPFDNRGTRFEEALSILPRIWAETEVAAVGSGWHARSVTALPRPHQRPHPPLWIGGNSRAAMRRAIEFGNGWSPFPTPPGSERYLRTDSIADVATLSARLDEFQQRCADSEHGEQLSTCFVPWSQADFLKNPHAHRNQFCNEIAELAELGVDWLAVSCPGLSPQEVTEEAERLAQDLDSIGLKSKTESTHGLS